MGRYFGTDGIRGKANEGLNAERAFLVGRYLGYYYSQQGRKKILIGKDTRLSSSMLENALAAGIAADGCDAYLAGYCPTPMIAYLTRNEDFEAGAMISASHNPFYDNGIKMFSKEGIKLSADIEALIEDFIDGISDIPYKTNDEIGRIIRYEKGMDDYLNWLKKEFPLDLHGTVLALDCANGSSSYTAERLLTALGAECIMSNSTPDGVNINTQCGSTHPEHLQAMVKEHSCDLGLAFDGDADRLIAVDPDGSLVTGDDMLYIAGRYLKEKGQLKGNTVVTTVMANLGLFKALERDGINVCSTAVGDKYVYEKMCQEDYVVGGEQSGHIIFKKHLTTGDGLLSALQMLTIMKDTGKGIHELRQGLRIYPQLLVNIKVTDKEKAMKDEEVLKAEEETAAKLGNNGRILVRASGTEPLVRVMVEAETDEICASSVDSVASIVKQKYGI